MCCWIILSSRMQRGAVRWVVLAFQRILLCPWLQHRCENLISENLCWIYGLNRLRTGELPAVGFIDCEPAGRIHVTWNAWIAERNWSVEQSLVTIISHPRLFSNGLWFTRFCHVYWPGSKMPSPTCGADSRQLAEKIARLVSKSDVFKSKLRRTVPWNIFVLKMCRIIITRPAGLKSDLFPSCILAII